MMRSSSPSVSPRARCTGTECSGWAATPDRWFSLAGKADGSPRVWREREPSPPDHAAGARGALGLLVHVHRVRPPRPRAVDADPAPDGGWRGGARRLDRL